MTDNEEFADVNLHNLSAHRTFSDARHGVLWASSKYRPHICRFTAIKMNCRPGAFGAACRKKGYSNLPCFQQVIFHGNWLSLGRFLKNNPNLN